MEYGRVHLGGGEYTVNKIPEQIGSLPGTVEHKVKL